MSDEYVYERTELGLIVALCKPEQAPAFWLPDGVEIPLPASPLVPVHPRDWNQTPLYPWVFAVLSDRAMMMSPLDAVYGKGWGATYDSIEALPTTT